MHSIRKVILRCCIVFAIVLGLESAVRLCYEGWDRQTLQSKKERESLEGTLDTVYLGTSLTYHAYWPEILDEALGTNSFNLGTASQPYIGSYYLLRETAEVNPIQRVYVTLSLPPLLEEEIQAQEYVSAFENMRSWKWKLRYLATVNQENVWIPTLIYSTQVENYLDFESVQKNLNNKLITNKVSKVYTGRGFRGTKTIYEGRETQRNTDINHWYAELGESQLLEEGINYLEKIAGFCREEGIQLTLVILPYTQDFIEGAGDVNDFHQYFSEKAEEWDAELYDFIRYKDRENVFTNEKFMDVHHMNSAGARAFSQLLAEVVQSDNPQSYFDEIIQ